VNAVPARPRLARRWRWPAVAIAAWVLVLVAAGAYAARHGRPTVREQTTIVQALPALDRGIADVVAAAQGPDVVAAIGGYARTAARCEVTAARHGERYERTVLLYTVSGRERALVDRIAAGLPRSYRVTVHHRDGADALRADAGFYVRLGGETVGPGRLRVTLDTGCREAGGAVPSPSTPPEGGRAPVQAVFARLGITVAHWRTHRVTCRPGRTLWTVEGLGEPGRAPDSLAEALRSYRAALLADVDAYAFRDGDAGVVASVRDGVLSVAATTGCAR
jgi:hypothetical protein